MNKELTYSVLHYRPSAFTKESLVIGLLLFFPAENRLEFRFPAKLNRLRSAYPDYHEGLIKSYLRAFEKQARKVSKLSNSYFGNLDTLVADHFLVPDASALQFEPAQYVFCMHLGPFINGLIRDLFGNYEKDAVSHRYSSIDVAHEVKRKAVSLNKEAKSLIRTDERKILTTNHVVFNADFYWQNGSTNYAKALSFDVANESKIIDTALLLNGKLQKLDLLPGQEVDFVIYEPEGSKFKGAIEEAKEILNENPFHPGIYSIDEYSQKIAKDIHA